MFTGISPYLASLRKAVGHQLLLVPAVGAIILDDQKRLLLQQRSEDGHWTLPSGAIDPGETPQEAVIREVKEETNLDVKVTSIAGVCGGRNYRHVYPGGDSAEFVVVLFYCAVIGGNLRPDGDESARLEYRSEDRLPKLIFPYPHELLFSKSE